MNQLRCALMVLVLGLLAALRAEAGPYLEVSATHDPTRPGCAWNFSVTVLPTVNATRLQITTPSGVNVDTAGSSTAGVTASYTSTTATWQRNVSITGAQLNASFSGNLSSPITLIFTGDVGNGTPTFRDTVTIDCSANSACLGLVDQSVTCREFPAGTYTYIWSIKLVNLSSCTLNTVRFTSQSGGAVQTQSLNPNVVPGDTFMMGISISGGQPNTTFSAVFNAIGLSGLCCTQPFQVTLPTCNSPQAPCLVATANAINFGQIGGASATRTLTIINTSSMPRFYTITAAGTPPRQYTITPSPTTIPAGGSQTVTITVNDLSLPATFLDSLHINVSEASGAPLCTQSLPMSGGFLQSPGLTVSNNGCLLFTPNGPFQTGSVTLSNSNPYPVTARFLLATATATGPFQEFRPVALADTQVQIAASSSATIPFLFVANAPGVNPISIDVQLLGGGKVETVRLFPCRPTPPASQGLQLQLGWLLLPGTSGRFNVVNSNANGVPLLNVGTAPNGAYSAIAVLKLPPGLTALAISSLVLTTPTGAPLDSGVTVHIEPPLPYTLHQGDSIVVTIHYPPPGGIAGRKENRSLAGKSVASSANNARLVIFGDNGDGTVGAQFEGDINSARTTTPMLDESVGATEFAVPGTQMVPVLNPGDAPLVGRGAARSSGRALRDDGRGLADSPDIFRIDPSVFPLTVPPHSIAYLPVEFLGSHRQLEQVILGLAVDGGDTLETILTALGDGTVGVDGEIALRAINCELAPSQTSERSRLEFTLAEAAEVEVTLFEPAGQVVAQPLASKRIDAGHHTLTIDVRGLAAGTYFCAINAGSQRALRKLIVVR